MITVNNYGCILLNKSNDLDSRSWVFQTYGDTSVVPDIGQGSFVHVLSQWEIVLHY